MKCPTCGYDNLSSGVSTCPVCGTTLAGDAKLAAPATATRGTDSREPPNAQTTATAGQSYGTLPQAKALERLPSLNYPTFGRKKQLKRIVKALRAREMVLLYGPAGTGKSDLAAEAARELRDAFKEILWISEVGLSSVSMICDTIATHMGNQEIPKLALREKCAPTRALLAANDPLLILNDLMSSEVIAALIELCIPADLAVLGTSRRPHAAFDLAIEISRLERSAAADIFLQRAKLSAADDGVGKICDMLENDPLAIVLAAGCVGGDAALLPDLLMRLSAEKTQLLAQEVGTDADQNRTAWTSVNIRSALHVSYATLNEQQRQVFDVLVACFGETTGGELLSDICGHQYADCVGLATELVERALAERVDDRFSLQPLVRDLGCNLLGDRLQFVHDRILQGVLTYTARHTQPVASDQDKLRAELSNLERAVQHAYARDEWFATIALANRLHDALDTPIHWDELAEIGQLGILAAEALGDQQTLARLLQSTGIVLGKQRNDTQARQLLERSLAIKKQVGDGLGVAQIKYQLGTIAHHQGHYDSACRFFEESSTIYAQAGHPLGVADCLHQLGLIYEKQNNYQRAISSMQAALQVRRDAQGTRQPEFALILNDLGEVYRMIGEYTVARRNLLRALAISCKLLGEQHLDVADCLTNLGRLYYSMGQYPKAEHCYQQTLTIRSAALGAQHPYVAQSLNNLAALYYGIGDYERAQANLLKATEIYRKTLGENHPDVASSLNNLAGIHYAIGNYAAAAPLYSQALKIRREILGEQHLDTAQSLNNLALVHEALGNYAEAEPLLQQALKIRQNILGPRHAAVAQSLNNLALLHEALGNYTMAKALCQQALEIRRYALQARHPDIAQSLNNLAELYRLTGEYDQAHPLYQEALAIYRDALGPRHLYVAQTLTNLAELCEAMDDQDPAEAYYHEALQIRVTALGDQHLDVATSAINLAELYEGLDRYAAAEPFYQQALAIRRKALGAEHPDVAAVALSLAELYMAMEKPELAESLYQEARAIYHATLGENHTYVAHALDKLSDIARDQHRFDTARDWLDQSLTIKEKLGDKAGTACNFYRIGRTYQDQGDPVTARNYYQQSQAIYQELSDKAGIIRTRYRLGTIAQVMGEVPEARHHYEQSLYYAQELGLQKKADLITASLANLPSAASRQTATIGSDS